MNLSQIVKSELDQQLQRCQQDIDNLSDSIAILKELLIRRQEDEDKIVQALQILQIEVQVDPWNVSSLLFFETEDYS